MPRGRKRQLPVPGMAEPEQGGVKGTLVHPNFSHKKTMAMGALAVQGFTAKEIAELLELQPGSVEKGLYRLRQRGKLVDSEDKLDHGIIPAAIEGLMELVKAGDRDAILGALKGRGLFKHHAAGGKDAGVAVQTNLVVKFEVPGGGEKPALLGQVVGVARGSE